MFGVALRAKHSFAPGSWREGRGVAPLLLPACISPHMAHWGLWETISAECFHHPCQGKWWLCFARWCWVARDLAIKSFLPWYSRVCVLSTLTFFPPIKRNGSWLTQLNSCSNHFFLITTFERGNYKGSHCSGFMVAVVWEAEGKSKREKEGRDVTAHNHLWSPYIHTDVCKHTYTGMWEAGKESCTCSRCRKENVCLSPMQLTVAAGEL